MRTFLLCTIVYLFLIPNAFSQNIIGPEEVCLNQPYQYSFTWDKPNIAGFSIKLVGGNIGGRTEFSTSCYLHLGQDICPIYDRNRLSNLRWTSRRTKKITVTFFDSSLNVISSDVLTVREKSSPTPKITGPNTVSSSAWFQISGSFKNVKWSITPSGTGVRVAPYGNNKVLVSNVNNSSNYWHLLRFEGTEIDPCGNEKKRYGSFSFYKKSSGGGWSFDREPIADTFNSGNGLKPIDEDERLLKPHSFEIFDFQGVQIENGFIENDSDISYVKSKQGLNIVIIRDVYGNKIDVTKTFKK